MPALGQPWASEGPTTGLQTGFRRGGDANTCGTLVAAGGTIDVVPCPRVRQMHMTFLGFRASAIPLHRNPIQQVGPSPIQGFERLMKDAVDFLGALSLIFVCLPIFLVVPILIYLDSGGPVIFTQYRFGEGGRLFRIYKFRTLHAHQQDLSGIRQVCRQDPRVTRIGRFLRASSIDELPQLFNVLRGDLSLVGPRPHPLSMRTEGRLSLDITPKYMQRYRVKPGMTGLAQIRGHRGPMSSSDQLVARVESDLEYIETWSLAQDLKILLLTPVRLVTQSVPR